MGDRREKCSPILRLSIRMSVTQTLDSANQLPLPSEYEPRCHLPWMMIFLLLFLHFSLSQGSCGFSSGYGPGIYAVEQVPRITFA